MKGETYRIPRTLVRGRWRSPSYLKNDGQLEIVTAIELVIYEMSFI